MICLIPALGFKVLTFCDVSCMQNSSQQIFFSANSHYYGYSIITTNFNPLITTYDQLAIQFNSQLKRKALKLTSLIITGTSDQLYDHTFICNMQRHNKKQCKTFFISSTHSLTISLELSLSLLFILSLICYSMQHNVKTDTKVSENLIKLCKKDQKIIISYPLLITY